MAFSNCKGWRCRLRIISLCISCCPLKLHWKNALNDERAYYINTNGVGPQEILSLQEALESDDFDFITFQQGSVLSGKAETYYPYIENLFRFVRVYHPDAEILLYQAWAYEKGYERLSEYENSQDVTSKSIKQAHRMDAEILQASIAIYQA